MVEITRKRDINLRIRFKTKELADEWRQNPASPKFEALREALGAHRFVLLDQMERFRSVANDPEDSSGKKAEVEAVLNDPARKEYYDRVFIAAIERAGYVFDRLTVNDKMKAFVKAMRRGDLKELFDVQGFAYPETKYQIRLVLTEEFNSVVQEEGYDSTAKLLHVIDLLDQDAQDSLQGMKLSASSQLDNFMAYVEEVKAAGADANDGGLANWTVDVISKPEKVNYYSKTLVIHVDGKEMNDPVTAMKLVDAFRQLEGTDIIERIKIADDNPANNPHAPRIFNR